MPAASTDATADVLKELLNAETEPIVATTPEDLAEVLGLSAAAAEEWQVQRVLLRRLKEIARKRNLTHAEYPVPVGSITTA